MGRPLQVVNMETSPIFLFGILFLLVGTTAADNVNKHDPKPEETKCNPKKSDCEDKNNQYCQDMDGDGHWTCACNPGYSRDIDGFCELSVCQYNNHHDGEYRTVKGNCYYYQKSSMQYVDAVANCKSKFGGSGRLFEPRSKKDNTDVVGLARAISPNQPFWIGIRAQPHDEDHKHYYLSEGPKVDLAFDGWLDGEPNDVGNNEDCVSVLRFGNDLGWDDAKCDNEEYSICEQDVKEGCGSPGWATDNFCDDENNKPGCNFDGGACCHNPLDIWDKFCKDCECKNGRLVAEPCVDLEKTCKKKCKGKKCKKSNWCKTNCQKTCDNCPE